MKYSIFIFDGGLGKAVAATAVAAAIKTNHPDRELIVVCPWPEVFLNNRNVYRVYRSGIHPYFYVDYIKDKDSLIFKGEPYFTTPHIHKKQHVIKSWCDMFGIKSDDHPPQLTYNAAEIHLLDIKFAYRPKPKLILQTCGGLLTSNKNYCWTRDIPQSQAQSIVDALHSRFTIMHVTRPNAYRLNNVEVVPELPKRELLGLLLTSNKRILIDSCLQHAAAAFKMPSTVCWVGTDPRVFGYDLHTNIVPVVDKSMDNLIDSFLFDYSFAGDEHECPYYTTSTLFDVDNIIDTVESHK
jgi:hypothetical protein